MRKKLAHATACIVGEAVNAETPPGTKLAQRACMMTPFSKKGRDRRGAMPRLEHESQKDPRARRCSSHFQGSPT